MAEWSLLVTILLLLLQQAFLTVKARTVPSFLGLWIVFFLFFLAAIIFLLSLRWPRRAARI
jgi:hypothetical protein